MATTPHVSLTELLDPIEFWRKLPGGPPARLLCGHRRNRHPNQAACLRAALDAIDQVLHNAPSFEGPDNTTLRPL